jgi:hypothetical protein
LLDGDGSIFEGEILPVASKGAMDAQTSDAFFKKERGTAGNDGSLSLGTRLKQLGETNLLADTAVVPVPFRVSGTSRSLNQLVVISGTLTRELATTGSLERLAAGQRASGPARAPTVNAAPVLTDTASSAVGKAIRTHALSRDTAGGTNVASSAQTIPGVLRFRAKANIGGTNELLLDAVHVTPARQ